MSTSQAPGPGGGVTRGAGGGATVLRSPQSWGTAWGPGPPRRGRVPAGCHPASEGRRSLRAGGLCTQGRMFMGDVAQCNCRARHAGRVAESPACTSPWLVSPGLLSLRTVQVEQAGGQAFLQ